MTIKFEKVIELSGETWYKIWANDTCIKVFSDNSGTSELIKQKAQDFYKEVIKRAEAGYPIKQLLASQTITPKP